MWRGWSAAAASIDPHVWHPTDAGWTLPFSFLPNVLPRALAKRAEPDQIESPRTSCGAGAWNQRRVFSAEDEAVLACCGLWALQPGWRDAPVQPGSTFDAWLRNVSHLTAMQETLKKSGRTPYMQDT